MPGGKKLNKEKEKRGGRGPLGDAGSPGLCAHMWQTSLQKSIPSSGRVPGFSQALVDCWRDRPSVFTHAFTLH